MSDTRPNRNALREAFDAGNDYGHVGTRNACNFDSWYDKTYPPPLPAEPPIGSVRGGRWGGADFVWHRRYDGLWYAASKGGVTGCSWAEAIEAGLAPNVWYARC